MFDTTTSITLTADALDTDGTIAKVEFLHGTTLIGQDTTAPYSLPWNNVGAGHYALTARATDNSGAVSTSAVVNVFVKKLIPAGSTWKYLDNGSNQGTGWRQVGFNDASWASGPAELGYGDGGEATVVSYGSNANNKYITTYFRRAFAVNDPAGFSSIVVRLKRDDGAVIYVNGVEAHRSNMPGGTISYTSLADELVDGTDESTFFTSVLDSGLFTSGPNVVAVEIHQINVTSSDISFDLELLGNVKPPIVTWVSPANNSQFTASDDITLTAQATDDIGIKKVVFFRDDVRLGETSTGTGGNYSFVWTDAVAGVHQLTAKAIDLGGMSATSSQLITINVLSNALFVVNSTTLTTAETAIKNRLEALGYVVTIKTASGAVTADAYGKTVVVISSTVTSSSVNTKFRDVTVPVITWEEALYDDMKMTGLTGGTDYGTTGSQTQVAMTGTSHPLAAGLSGTVTVVSSATTFIWGRPTANSVKIATLASDSTKVVIYGYEKGSLMNGQPAPGRRVGFFLGEDSASILNANGWALFDAAILWASEYPCFPAVDAMIVMDRSSSMLGQPFVDAKHAASNFVTHLQLTVDQAGLVSFASSSTLNMTLSDNAAEIIDAIFDLSNSTGSRIDHGILTARQHLASAYHNPSAAPVILLLSDGIPSSGATESTVLTEANAAKAAGIRIFTVGFGNVNPTLLQSVASSPGDFYYGTESSDLEDLFRSIALSLCRTTNQPPSVQITAPASGAVFNPPANIQLQATASDSDGTVTKVEFYFGATKIGEDTTSPYSVTWNNAPPGTHEVTAVAYDDDGLFAVSQSIIIKVNSAPVVDAEPESQTIEFGQAASLTGTVTDDGLPSGVLTVSWSKLAGPGTVSFGNPNATATTATFSAAGTYLLQLAANDTAAIGADDVIVIVNPPVTVNAGPDQTIWLDETTALEGVPVAPGSGETLAWSVVGGPGPVDIDLPSAGNSDVAFAL
ncbi:MAG TPA: Ig-like domain-containing protein, partial [Verrucomicrobiae bacterium]|nr:Ig-like domain-containing protein [Verrucomicrobiae bacterium]